jgi:uncharacterized OB-fold protein
VRGAPLREGLFIWPESADLPTSLRASRCRSCGALTFPFVPACPACDAGGPVEEVALSPAGRVFEMTTVRSPAPGFTAPYDVGYVDLPEGVRVFAQLDVNGDRHLRAGDAVRIAFRPFGESDGRPVIGYTFARDRG